MFNQYEAFSIARDFVTAVASIGKALEHIAVAIERGNPLSGSETWGPG